MFSWPNEKTLNEIMLQQHVQSLAFYLLLHRLKDGLAGSTSKHRAPAEQHNRTFPFTWKGQKKKDFEIELYGICHTCQTTRRFFNIKVEELLPSSP